MPPTTKARGISPPSLPPHPSRGRFPLWPCTARATGRRTVTGEAGGTSDADACRVERWQRERTLAGSSPPCRRRSTPPDLASSSFSSSSTSTMTTTTTTSSPLPPGSTAEQADDLPCRARRGPRHTGRRQSRGDAPTTTSGVVDGEGVVLADELAAEHFLPTRFVVRGEVYHARAVVEIVVISLLVVVVVTVVVVVAATTTAIIDLCSSRPRRRRSQRCLPPPHRSLLSRSRSLSIDESPSLLPRPSVSCVHIPAMLLTTSTTPRRRRGRPGHQSQATPTTADPIIPVYPRVEDLPVWQYQYRVERHTERPKVDDERRRRATTTSDNDESPSSSSPSSSS